MHTLQIFNPHSK